MTLHRMVELLEIEMECVRRNGCGECNRACHICDLLQDDTELHEMYAEVIARMKAQTSCEDAVSREAVNDAIARSAHWADMKGRIDALPSVKPVPMARVMTLEEWKNLPEPKDGECLCYEINDGSRLQAMLIKAFTGSVHLYGKAFRCWTSRPDEKRRAETPWDC